MDPSAARVFSQTCAAYLEEMQVYDCFEAMLKEVVLHQPEDPLQFMVDYLKRDVKLMIVVMGASGVNRSEHAKKLAEAYNLPLLSAGALIKQHLEATGNTEALADMASGLFVRDDLVIDAVLPEVQKNKTKGFVLDGFPRTRPQAVALQASKTVPDKVLLLNAPQHMIESRLKAKVSGDGADEKVARRLQQFIRHLLQTTEVYQQSVMQLNIEGLDSDAVLEALKRLVTLRAYSNAPLQPVRCCILGPLGSGRTTLSSALAARYGAVHVDVAAIVREMKERGAVSGDTLVEQVDDAALCEAVRARLEQYDCGHKGWILDGFPLTKQQSQFLSAAHLMPARAVQLSCSADEVMRRLACRKYDPATGLAYYGPPSSVAIRQRLRQHKNDTPEVVKQRFENYGTSHKQVVRQFRASVTLSADGDPQTLTEQALDFIDRPLEGE